MARGAVVEGDNPPSGQVKNQINSRFAKLMRDAGVIGGSTPCSVSCLEAWGISVERCVRLAIEYTMLVARLSIHFVTPFRPSAGNIRLKTHVSQYGSTEHCERGNDRT